MGDSKAPGLYVQLLTIWIQRKGSPGTYASPPSSGTKHTFTRYSQIAFPVSYIFLAPWMPMQCRGLGEVFCGQCHIGASQKIKESMTIVFRAYRMGSSSTFVMSSLSTAASGVHTGDSRSPNFGSAFTLRHNFEGSSASRKYCSGVVRVVEPLNTM